MGANMACAPYLLGCLLTVLAMAYGSIVLLAHYPRAATPSENRYLTNDGQGPVHALKRLDSSKGDDDDHSEEQPLQLTVVVPSYNETGRLGKMLEEAVAYLNSEFRDSYEIMIVDDASKDGTSEFALAEADRLGLEPGVLKVVKLSENRGKGGAVTHGVLRGRGRLILFADADGATQFSDISKLVKYMETKTGPAVAVGSRAHMVDTDAVVKRSVIRNFLMYGLHTLVYVFGIRGVQDTQCGFKMFNRESVRKIFPYMHTERWIFDVEILLLSELQKIPIGEIPVNWQEIDGSKVDLAKDCIQMAIDLVVTRMAYLLGLYRIRDFKKTD